MAKRKFYHAVFKVEILSRESFSGLEELDGLVHSMHETGEDAGVCYMLEQTEINPMETAAVLKRMGYDPGMFHLDHEGNDLLPELRKQRDEQLKEMLTRTLAPAGQQWPPDPGRSEE